MAKISRDRGAKFEREVANFFKAWGYDSYRTAQHMGKTGQAPDVVADGLHIEAKRRRSLAVMEFYHQAERDAKAEGKGNIPTVFMRADGEPMMVMQEANDWMLLYNEWRSMKTLIKKRGLENEIKE